MKIVDGDSHFIEPLDLYPNYVEPAFRERAMRVERDADGTARLLVDGKPLNVGMDIDDMLGTVVGYGQKEDGTAVGGFNRSLYTSADWQDMDRRLRFMDAEGLDVQVLYPTLGLLWDGNVEDPRLAAALCRAYNTWAFERCAGHLDRLLPVAHVSLRDAGLAVAEIERVAKLGARAIMVGSAPVDAKSFGHPDYDPVWAAAEDLGLAVSIHPAANNDYLGSAWYRHRFPGFMFISMNVIQDPRMSLTTMVYDGVFDRFPRLRAATVEAMGSWVGEWVERFEYRYQYMGHTAQMQQPIREYLGRNVWINADPSEKLLPAIVEFVGDDTFFVGSDYPHAEGFTQPVATIRNLLSRLPSTSVDRILGSNAAAFYGL